MARGVRGVFAGAGSDGLAHPQAVNSVLNLVARYNKRSNLSGYGGGTSRRSPNVDAAPTSGENSTVDENLNSSPDEGADMDARATVIYLGTASYDFQTPRERQTKLFALAGCTIHHVNVTSDKYLSITTEWHDVQVSGSGSAEKAGKSIESPEKQPYPRPVSTASLRRDVQVEASRRRRLSGSNDAEMAERDAVPREGLYDPIRMVNLKGGRIREAFESADVILVSGGNTLFAIDRWKFLGIDKLLAEAAQRGCVLCGGSAGAICWFDAGHSDSADPDSYLSELCPGDNRTKYERFFSKQHGYGRGVFRGEQYRKYVEDEAAQTDADAAGATAAQAQAVAEEQKDESSGAPKAGEEAKAWQYIRVEGLGLFPGLVCPHHDKVQSNGVLRAVDFDRMLAGADSVCKGAECGVCIDHWAALTVDKETDSFEVVAFEGKPGSVVIAGSEGAKGEAWPVFKGPGDECESKAMSMSSPNEETASAEAFAFSPEQKGTPGVWLKTVTPEQKVQLQLLPARGQLSALLKFVGDRMAPRGKVVDPLEDKCRRENPINQF